MSSENYVLKKQVDWSLLHQGISIPIKEQVQLKKNTDKFLSRGESKEITIVFEGKTYKATLKNQKFDEKKYPNHKDILQIRYSENNEFAVALRGYFSKTFRFIESVRAVKKQNGDKTQIVIPEDQRDYVAIYTSEYEDTFVMEAILSDEMNYLSEYANEKSERVLENQFDYHAVDPEATVVERKRTAKVRKLNQKIGENLKLLYGYRCQICGRLIGEEYGSKIAEAHHIDYFCKSMNNNASNLLVVCPNHHSIIHDANPVFDRRKLLYEYLNGKCEPLTLNKHL